MIDPELPAVVVVTALPLPLIPLPLPTWLPLPILLPPASVTHAVGARAGPNTHAAVPSLNWRYPLCSASIVLYSCNNMQTYSMCCPNYPIWSTGVKRVCKANVQHMGTIPFSNMLTKPHSPHCRNDCKKLKTASVHMHTHSHSLAVFWVTAQVSRTYMCPQ